jgi:hypothetical protein
MLVCDVLMANPTELNSMLITSVVQIAGRVFLWIVVLNFVTDIKHE